MKNIFTTFFALLFAVSLLLAVNPAGAKEYIIDGAPAINGERQAIKPVGFGPVKLEHRAVGPVREYPGRDEEHILKYDDEEDIAWYWDIPSEWGGEWYYVRFRPNFAPFAIIGMQFLLYDMGGAAGNPGVRLAATTDTEGYPENIALSIFEVPNQNLRLSVDPPEGQPFELQWNEIRFPDAIDTFFVFQEQEDFYLLVNMAANPGENIVALLSDDGVNPTSNSGCLYDGEWWNLEELFEVGYNLCIRAIVDDNPQDPGGGGGNQGVFTVTPDTVKFGNVNVGGFKALSATVKNGFEDKNVTVIDVLVDGDFYTTDFNEEILLESGKSSEINFMFEPEASGAAAGTATIITDEDGGKDYLIHLTGVGVAPAITVTPADTLKFGAVKVGSNKAMNVTLKNTGNAPLTVSNVQIQGEQYTSDWAGQAKVLQAGATTTVRVTFTPDKMELIAGTMTITSDDPAKPRVTLPMSGTGSAAKLEVSADSLNFGGIAVGRSKTLPLVLKNAGTEDLSINSVNIDNISFYTDFARATVLRPNQTLDLAVTFEPDNADKVVTSMIIASTDPKKPNYSVKLSGAGSVPEADYAPENLNFGKVMVNASKELVVNVFSVGVSDLTVSNVSSNNNMYTTNFAEAKSVPAGTQYDIKVTFKPTQAGDHNGVLSIVTDDPAHANIQIPLAGVGGAPSISADKNAIHFESVDIGKSKDATIKLSNNGTADLTIINIKTTAVGFTSDFAGQFVIQQAGSKDVKLTFSPAEEGMYLGTFLIISDDPVNDTLTVFVDGTGTKEVGVESEFSGVPGQFVMKGGYPNPFNAVTTVRYGVPFNAEVSLNVYNMSGNLVATLAEGNRTAGYHIAVWDAKGMPAGVYLVRMTSEGYSSIAKIVLVK